MIASPRTGHRAAGEHCSSSHGGGDTHRGGPGDNMLWGRNHDDQLHGGPGDDTLNGNSGTDHLDGGESY